MENRIATVEQLLKLKQFNKQLKLLNKKANCSKPITHVTIMEAPDLHEWVTGGEFVLTTWYSLSKDRELAEQSFRKLAPKISAIGIKTKRFIDEIPKFIIDIADENDLPVFEIARETKFRELVHIISLEIQNYQLNMLTEAEYFYQDLLEASLESDDVGNTLQTLSTEIGMPCTCLNYELKTAGSCGQSKLFDNLDSIKEKISEEFILKNDIMFQANIEGISVMPCYIRKKLVGFLLVPSEALDEERIKLSCQQAMSFLAAKLWSTYENVQKLRTDFMLKFASEENMLEEDIRLNFKKFGVVENKKLSCACIYVEDDVNKTFSFLDSLFTNKIIAISGELLMVIGEVNSLNYAFLKLKTRLKQDNINYLIIRTDGTDDVYFLRNYFQLSIDTSKLLNKLGMSGTRRMQDWAVYTMILYCQTSPGYQFIWKNVLDPIYKYDELYNGCLLQSLYITVITESVTKAAEILHVHVNTLRYRLEKIHEITNKNYFAPMDKHELIVATFIGEIEGYCKDFSVNNVKKQKFEY